MRLTPRQVMANDINRWFLQVLSLRLGMKFIGSISPENSPTISVCNIADLDDNYFDNVKIVLCNPPYYAGAQIGCTERKNTFYERIINYTGNHPITNFGQTNLEVAFLELLTSVVRNKTVVACIMPKTHLFAQSNEMIAYRRMLLEKFGLNTIFCYPGDGLFNRVDIDTCVLVGTVGEQANRINVLYSYNNIADLDYESLYRSLPSIENTDNYQVLIDGLTAMRISRMHFLRNINMGWRFISPEMARPMHFNSIVNENELMVPIDIAVPRIKRGGNGNKGASKLIFLNRSDSLYIDFQNDISFGHGLVHAKDINEFLVNRVLDQTVPVLDPEHNSDNIIRRVISEYYNHYVLEDNRQKKYNKTEDDYVHILNSEIRVAFSGYLVLLPRAIRTTGRVFLVDCHDFHFFVSTNFIGLQFDTYRDSLLVGTWMTTVFYL